MCFYDTTINWLIILLCFGTILVKTLQGEFGVNVLPYLVIILSQLQIIALKGEQ